MSEQIAKILIVDDVSANLFALQQLLKPCHAEVIQASSGNEALQLALKHHFSLALIDVQMPEMDGYETADLLLGEDVNKDVPIIFITAAYKDEMHRIKGYKLGAIDYIEKPVDDFILLSKVNVFLKLFYQQQDLIEKNNLLNSEAKKRALLLNELKKLMVAVEQSPVAVIITDNVGTIEFVNTTFEHITGYTKSECLGKKPSILKSDSTPDSTYKDLWSTLIAGHTWRGDFYNKKKNGELFWEHAVISPVWGDNDTITHFIAVKEDITQRKQYEKELLKQYNYDHVTDLPNRVLALDRMAQATAIAEASQLNTTIIFVDIDNFKKINDTLGRDFGNRVLVGVAGRLTDCIRKNDTVACMGRDEFILILPGLEKITPVDMFCQQLLNQFKNSFMIDDHEIYVSLSLGISQSPEDGCDPHGLIQNAEAAMAQAKAEGGNSYRYFFQQMNVESAYKLKMETRLRQAIEQELLQVYYQPLVDCKTGCLLGAEALIRWFDEELGTVSPEIFIPFAESSGLIDDIGEWVLTVATRQTRLWQEKYATNFCIAVNFSAHQFFNLDIKDRIERILKQTGLSTDTLEIEITERLLMLDQHDVLSRLNEINQTGVSLSIDDFGTGYSSLSYLKRFPVSTVKIDKSFINEVCTDPEDAILTKTIINMAHSLNMKVIAEGVETKEQLIFLQQHGCDFIQGYYYSKPVDADDFEPFFSQFKPGVSS